MLKATEVRAAHHLGEQVIRAVKLCDFGELQTLQRPPECPFERHRARRLRRLPARLGVFDRDQLFIMTHPIQKTDAELQAVLREKGAEPVAFQVTAPTLATERPFTGKQSSPWADGSYHCICCGAKLFVNSPKFDAGCGWPSFSQAIPGAITEIVDRSHGMVRTEKRCAHNAVDLGHVFEDGRVRPPGCGIA